MDLERHHLSGESSVFLCSRHVLNCYFSSVSENLTGFFHKCVGFNHATPEYTGNAEH
jgi:hypothetical protein